MREKFAAKFAEAGNLKLRDVSQISYVGTTRSGLDIDRFPQHFSAGCKAVLIWKDLTARLKPAPFPKPVCSFCRACLAPVCQTSRRQRTQQAGLWPPSCGISQGGSRQGPISFVDIQQPTSGVALSAAYPEDRRVGAVV